MMKRGSAFTLIELLVTIAILTLLIGILLPSLRGARASAKNMLCLTRMGELSKGFQMYTDDHRDVFPPSRMPQWADDPRSDDNLFDVGNGLKFRPRWPAIIGVYVGAIPFADPARREVRQPYVHETYHCPTAPDWTDERNYAYGYNYQFLGNTRQRNDEFIQFPVYRTRMKAAGQLVIFADCMGTAAGFTPRERRVYNPAGTQQAEFGNHGYTLDPPRLTVESDRGTGDDSSRRSAVDPRHSGRANVVFADGHGEAQRDEELGYRRHEDGRYVDLDPVNDPQPHNRAFTLSGRDEDPPRREP